MGRVEKRVGRIDGGDKGGGSTGDGGLQLP
jgi:hypothetical protein